MVVSTRKDLERQLAVRQALTAVQSETSLAAYLDRVIINSAPAPALFKNVREQWQTDLWHKMDRALEDVAAGRLPPDPHGFMRFMPRGHDKTGAIARRVNWLLTYGRRPLTIITAAADQEQAGLITDSMRTEIQLNPWLPVKVHRNRAYGPSGVLKVMSSNAPTTWGLGADVYIIDELTWWEKQDLWEPLFSAWRKRKGAVFIVISNTGVEGSWQWDWTQKFKQNSDWDLYSVPERTWLAGWMDKVKIDRDRETMDPSTAARVFDNVWVEPGAMFGYLTREDVNECERLGRELGLREVSVGRYGVDYVAGIDYGPKRDRTVLVVCHHNHARQIVLDLVTVWQGGQSNPVQVQRVREWVDDVNKRFHRPQLVVDPYQLEGLCQDYEYKQIVTRFEARGGKSNYEMASTLKSLVVNRQLAWYPGAGDLVITTGVETMADEFRRLVVRPMPYGYRFDHEVRFHDDRAVAVGMAALYAARNPPAPAFGTVPEYRTNKRPVLPELRVQEPGRGLWGL